MSASPDASLDTALDLLPSTWAACRIHIERLAGSLTHLACVPKGLRLHGFDLPGLFPGEL
jgi:hypothetical protein